MIAIKGNPKPFIFASSQMSNMLHSNYGILKLLGESYTNALNGIIVKFWNVYGYENIAEKSHVITDFIKRARDNNKIIMKTDGLEERQFLFGRDCAECLTIISKEYKNINKIKPLHITSFKWTSIIEIANIISLLFDNCQVIPSNLRDEIQGNIKNQPDDYILSFWKPRTDINHGIEEMVKLYLEENDA